MELNALYADRVGLIHLLASIAALLSGTAVLILAKGTRTHKRVGYIYTAAMAVLLVTAFSIYRLFGGWGIFHWLAVISTITLLGGLLPILMKRPKGAYIGLHFSFMYWSIMGLYAAFLAETMVRLPRTDLVFKNAEPSALFFSMTGLAVTITMGLAVVSFIKFRPKWQKRFAPAEEPPEKNRSTDQESDRTDQGRKRIDPLFDR